jgi:aldehyde:ferredoxin oxidoreductase
MKGYAGKFLRLNLTNQTKEEIHLKEDIARSYIGGKGFGAHLLLSELDKDVDPLSPDSIIAFFTGPFTGTMAPTSNRYGAFFKSPLTGIWGEAYAGGYLAPQIRRAGYDGIIITGRANSPIFISIIDGEVHFHDASHLWGMNTRETEDAVTEEIGQPGAKVMTIGPAGENMVNFACISNDYFRQLGRAGGGAVMGSKNLKAIAVKGTKNIDLADKESFAAKVKEILAKIPKDGPLTVQGTPVMVNAQNALGTFPTHYWQKGFFDAHDTINAQTMLELIVDKNKACWNCPVSCGKLSSVKEGEYKGAVVEGPEYETIYAFGGLCEIADIRAVTKANEICDLLGLDTITAGNVVGFTMRANELERLELGFPLDFGSAEDSFKLLRMISYREGIGDILADGVMQASKFLDLEDIAVHVKGLEPPGYDPRGYNGMALSYGVGVRGADHLRSSVFLSEGRGVVDRFAVEGKGRFVKGSEDFLAIVDSMIVCNFVMGAYCWEDFADLYKYATGFDTSPDELKLCAERIVNTARAFSTREGISRKDDYLPSIFHEVPFIEGSSKAHVVVKEDYERMLDEYYKARKWSEEGIPPEDL